MTFRPITQADIQAGKVKRYIDIYLPIAGHKAVEYWWNSDEFGSFWELWQTGDCAYSTAKEAYTDAKVWAEYEDKPYMSHPELE